MRAMHYTKYAGPLTPVELPQPVPGANQVLVQVHAGSVNPIDWKQASGKMKFIMPVKLPCVPGYDLAGVVVAAGPGADKFTVGMRVHTRLSGLNGGASAEFALCGTDVLTPMPTVFDFAQAAGLPLAGMTALQGLRDQTGLPMQGATERVLVVGASGGVGHIAVQIARAAGAHVVGVCSARNAALVRELGAHEAIDYAAANPYAGQAPFDIVLDCVGGDPGPWLPLLTAKGRYASTVPGPAVMLRMLLNPFTGRSVKPVMLKSSATDLQVLDTLAQAGKLKVVVDSTFPLAQLAEAWAKSKSSRVVGKLVITVVN